MPISLKKIDPYFTPAVVTNVMYTVLATVFLLQLDLSAPLPYKEINSCLEYNIESQYRGNSIDTASYIHWVKECEGPTEYIKTEELVRIFDSVDTHCLNVFQQTDSLIKKRTIDNKFLSLVDSLYYSMKRLQEYYSLLVDPREKYQFDADLHYFFYPIAGGLKDFRMQFYGHDRFSCVTLVNAIKNDLLIGTDQLKGLLAKERSCIIEDFDESQAIMFPENGYVVAGERVVAYGFIGAYNKAINPTLIASSGKVISVENGLVTWRDYPKNLGKHIVTGKATIEIDSTICRSWSFEYMVGAPGASMILDKANTCYMGIDNPMSISVPGYKLSQLDLRVVNAKVIKVQDGCYNIIPIKPGKLQAYVDATNTQGEVSTVAGLTLLAKPLPDPIPHLSGIFNTRATKEELKQCVLSVQQADTAFRTDYRLVQYEVAILPVKSTSVPHFFTLHEARLSSNADFSKVIDSLQPGDRIIISDIQVVNAGGKKLQVSGLGCKVK